jgi:predicted DNA-binding protein
MRQSFDEVLRIRVPASLSERLRMTASEYARSPSDVVREAVVVRHNELARRKRRELPESDCLPPEAA